MCCVSEQYLSILNDFGVPVCVDTHQVRLEGQSEIGQSSLSQEKDVAIVVGATSSASVLVVVMLVSRRRVCNLSFQRRRCCQ